MSHKRFETRIRSTDEARNAATTLREPKVRRMAMNPGIRLHLINIIDGLEPRHIQFDDEGSLDIIVCDVSESVIKQLSQVLDPAHTDGRITMDTPVPFESEPNEHEDDRVDAAFLKEAFGIQSETS